ncbi:helix-turn-helix domain-containing protein [Streptomyces sp. NPDC012746]|uniref:helix-turn-helix domain-containing protein n=1 Tax=Streptomyces sp. NPDC012746 TaxID=3364845 RepID=UPI0036AE7E0D
MRDGYGDLAKTIQTVEQLLSATGLDRDSVIDLTDLSFRTSLPEADLRVLLAGGRLAPVESFDHEVTRRIRFLTESRLYEYEGAGGVRLKRRHTPKEIAEACGMTRAWLSSLLLKPKAPNLAHSKGLADFFGVPVEFLTDEPVQALTRALETTVVPYLRAFTVSPAEAITNRFAVKVAHRLKDAELQADEEAALMLMVSRIADGSASLGHRS